VKRSSYILTLLLLITANSCVRNIEIDVDGERRVVVYSVLEADKEPRVFLYKSLPYEFDLSVIPFEFISEATVFIVVNGERIPLRLEQSFDKTIFSGIYLPDMAQVDSVPVTYFTSDHKVLHGQTYELEVLYQGDRITGTTRVPNAVDFSSVKVYRDSVTDDEGELIIRDILELKLQDDASERNYYKYTVSYRQESIVETETGPELIRVNYDFLRPRFISDEGNNGRIFTIRFLLSDKVNTFQNPDLVVDINTSLISYAPDLFEFNRSLASQGGDEDLVLNPFREPVIIKSNIAGGLGIFSSMSQSRNWTVPYQPGF
jgi:hypothetical protein